MGGTINFAVDGVFTWTKQYMFFHGVARWNSSAETCYQSGRKCL